MTCTDTQKLIKIIRDKSNDLLDSELRLLLVEDVVSLVDDELESVHLLVQTPALVQLGPEVLHVRYGEENIVVRITWPPSGKNSAPPSRLPVRQFSKKTFTLNLYKIR